MSSYLAQFNYQFLRPAGISVGPDDFRRSELRRFVFLHGLMGYGANWRKITSGLGPNDIALVYDQRGHGKSWKPLTGYSPEDYAEDLELIRQEIGWEQFYLVGHSMGGRNALVYASRFPDRVQKLLIEDIGPELRPNSIDYYRRMLDSAPTPFVSKLAAKEFFLNVFPKLGFSQHQPETLGQYLYSNIIETPDGRADWRFSKEAMLLSASQGQEQDRWNDLKNLSMPTLLIRGEQSAELTHEVYEKMLACNSKIQGQVIDNAGHWVHSDQPQLFLQVMLNFFDESER